MLYAFAAASIFSNMVMTPRHIVMTMGPVAVAIILALILSFCHSLTGRPLSVSTRPLALSTLQALAIGSPAVARLSAPPVLAFYLAPSARR